VTEDMGELEKISSILGKVATWGHVRNNVV